MSTITAAEFSTRALGPSTTRFERTLLRAASAIDAFVAGRLERRSGSDAARALSAQLALSVRRRDAEARGAIGILPR